MSASSSFKSGPSRSRDDFPWLANYPKEVSAEIDPTSYKNILSVFDESVRKFRTQRSFTNMDCSLTYEQLDQKVGDFASFLQNELKLRKGDRICIQMPNLLQYPVVLFGALRAGLVIVNTNPLYTTYEMEHQFIDSGARAIVILANYAHLLEKVLPRTRIEGVIITEVGDFLPAPKKWIVNSVVKYIKKMVPSYNLPQAYSLLNALAIGAKKAYQEIPISSDDLAFLQYTGGTTGVAKGAMLTHKNIISNMLQIVEWMKPRLIEGKEMVVTALPLYHIFSLTVNCLSLMKYGAENLLITNPRDIPLFIQTLKKYPFTVMTGVNTLFNALMNHEQFNSISFKSLKISVAGAMALQKPVAERWMKLTKTPVLEGYGLTETSPVACCNPISGGDRVGTIGLPLPSTQIKLVDDKNKEVKFGEAGELCIFGPQVMKGYWQKPEETAKVLIDGWVHTGDIAIAQEGGYFKIVDRKKDMILVSGFNVYPNEVEEAIASHPKVLEVAAIGVPDVHSGEVVKVFIVKKDPSLTEDEVLQHAKEHLTGYKLPKQVEFRKELPKTNVGKILRRNLRA